MMRKILFRGKCYDDGEWIFGSLLDDDIIVTKGAVEVDDDYINIVDEWSSVLPGTVGQYTGMWDCKGKMIFDGDIVVYNTTSYCVGIIYGAFVLERIDDDLIDYEDFPQNTFPCGCDETEFMGVCHDYCVSLFELSSNEQDFEGSLSCEVIGNRWDNPELLEVQG